MPYRTAHGKAAELGATKVWESTPSDEVRSAPEGSAVRIDRREDGTVTAEGAAELARKRWQDAKQPDFGDKAEPWMPPAPELVPFDGARKELLAQRRDELHEATGAVSSGVGAKLRGWAYIHAAGEYWASKFFATGKGEFFEYMVRAFKAASTESDKADDEAAREAAARPRDPMDAHRALEAAFGGRK